MSETLVKVDESRTAALLAAVSAGGAESVQDAVDSAVDAWLADRALTHLPDEALRRLWREGLESGDAGGLDFGALKAEARAAALAP